MELNVTALQKHQYRQDKRQEAEEISNKVCTPVCYCGPYLVYELLHPLHGVVSLQQRGHSHEPFIAALLFHFLFLLLFASSPFIFIYSSVLVALWDGLPRQETVISLGWTGRRHFLIFGQRAQTFSFFKHFFFLMDKRSEV